MELSIEIVSMIAKWHIYKPIITHYLMMQIVDLCKRWF